MGFWSKLGKIGLIAGGAIAAPYTGGASLAGALSVVQGLNASGAAKKATEQQTQASEKAMNQVIQPIQRQQEQIWNPYVSLGAGATQNLSALTGKPLGSAPGIQPLSSFLPGLSYTPNSGGVPMSAMTGQGQQVTLRAPDGSTQAVPAEQAQHYISLGATRVG